MRISKLITSCGLALGLATTAQAEGPNKLITILTAPEPQTQLMAMVDAISGSSRQPENPGHRGDAQAG